MPIGIDPKVDFAFKLVFGNPDHTAVTIHFLNAVLNFERPIVEVEILNPIQGKVRDVDKLAVLDVLATDPEGRRYNIEMQTTRPVDLVQRLNYYTCTNYVRQLKSGVSHHQLRPAITICVIDRVVFADDPQYHLSFRLRADQRTDLALSDDLAIHFLELPKYHAPSNNEEVLGPLEKWLFFLKHAAQLEPEELARLLAEEEYREAAGVLEMISETPEDREFYDSRRRIFDNIDYQLVVAREQGEVIGTIRTLQQMLGDEVSTSDSLAGLELRVLKAKLVELQGRMRSRGE